MNASEKEITRRSFLTGAAVIGAGMGLVGCAPSSGQAATKTASTGEVETTVNWRDQPEMPTEFAETVDADIVVVGAGNGGLVAATKAAQNGAKVIVLEKTGGIANARGDIGALNCKLNPDHTEDVPTLLNYAAQTQSGDADMLLYRTWAEKSGEMMEWMQETLRPKGMVFPLQYHKPDDEHAYYPAMAYNPILGEYNPNGPNHGGGQHLTIMQDILVHDLNAEIRFETPAQQLILDDSGKVTGVVAEGKDGFIKVTASKGVILCTGGYGANLDMLNELCPTQSKWCAASSATVETGDGIRMVLWAGGELEPGGSALVWNRAILPDGYEFNDERMGADLFSPGSQPFLHVNINGERFMNEDQPYPLSYGLGAHQPGHYSWMVWDDDYWKDIEQFDTCGCSRLCPAPSGSALNADVYDGEALTKDHLDSFWIAPRLEQGLIKQADTLEELADIMGFNSEQKQTFLSNVERYNELADSGNDVDFGKPTYRLSDVRTPPFYAARMAGLLMGTAHGVMTNTNSQPLRPDGSVIEGLYVCGNDQGGFYPHNYPSNLVGLNAGRTATFAYLAVKHALGLA